MEVNVFLNIALIQIYFSKLFQAHRSLCFKHSHSQPTTVNCQDLYISFTHNNTTWSHRYINTHFPQNGHKTEFIWTSSFSYYLISLRQIKMNFLKILFFFFFLGGAYVKKKKKKPLFGSTAHGRF